MEPEKGESSWLVGELEEGSCTSLRATECVEIERNLEENESGGPEFKSRRWFCSCANLWVAEIGHHLSIGIAMAHCFSNKFCPTEKV